MFSYILPVQQNSETKECDLSCIGGMDIVCSIFKMCINECLVALQLSAEQRREMCEHRRRSLQLQLNRQNQQRSNTITRVQSKLEKAQVSSRELYSPKEHMVITDVNIIYAIFLQCQVEKIIEMPFATSDHMFSDPGYNITSLLTRKRCIEPTHSRFLQIYQSTCQPLSTLFQTLL